MGFAPKDVGTKKSAQLSALFAISTDARRGAHFWEGRTLASFRDESFQAILGKIERVEDRMAALNAEQDKAA